MNSQTHLTHQQLCDLLLDSPTQQNDSCISISTAQDHLGGCYSCSAELAALTASLFNYRDTAHAIAQRDFTAAPRTAPTPLLNHHAPFHPVYWAIAATALVIAVLPFTAPRHTAVVQPQPTHAAVKPAAVPESDAALLNDINQDISVSIPPSMQPLADPTAAASSDTDIATQRTN